MFQASRVSSGSTFHWFLFMILGQALVLGAFGTVIFPEYEPPAGAMPASYLAVLPPQNPITRTLFLPPPPAPKISKTSVMKPPRIQPSQPKKVILREFDASALMAPRAVPERIAIIDDSDWRDHLLHSMANGNSGGLPWERWNGMLIDGAIGSLNGAVKALPGPPPDAIEPPAPPRLRVGGNVQSARVLRRVMPVYPLIARQTRIEGTVILRAVIAKDGSVQELQVISGNSILAPAAVDAVKKWKYSPTLLNGIPVEVDTEIHVRFILTN